MNPSTVTNNIKAEMKRRGIKSPEMMNAMDLKSGTYYNRMKHPEDLTIGNLIDAARLMQVPVFVLMHEEH